MQVARDTSFSGFHFRRVPPAVLLLIAITVAASLSWRWLAPIGILVPRLFWSGQVWRMVSWVFFELSPMQLVIQCLMLYWFGRDLEEEWGSRKLVGVYLGFAAGAGAVTCLAALISPTVMSLPYFGGWALTEALTIAWATLNPHREVFLYLVIKLRGRALIAATIGLTVLFAAYYGIGLFLPDFAAELGMLLFMSDAGPALRRRWERWRLRRRGPRLRIVEDDEEPPPTPPSPRPPRWVN